jgi:hypothetical protein
VDLRHSSENGLRTRMLRALVLLGSTLMLMGCVTVKPHEKELLADPAMVYGGGGEADVQEGHILTNREGSAGAAEGSGGGCGCN